jgi:hypothetical protein
MDGDLFQNDVRVFRIYPGDINSLIERPRDGVVDESESSFPRTIASDAGNARGAKYIVDECIQG